MTPANIPGNCFATSPCRVEGLLLPALPHATHRPGVGTTMNPADYDELTLDQMEFDLINNGKVSYGTTDETIESMYGIPGLPEAIELSTQ